MRVDELIGYYVQYRDSGKPVEVLDRVSYAFQSEDRTCLIENPSHLALLLKTDRYRIVGVEVRNGSSAPLAPPEGRRAGEVGGGERPRVRPRKGR